MTFLKNFLLRMALIVVPSLLALLCLSSCYTQKKATRQITRAQSTFPEIVAKGCAAWYPVRAFDSVRIEYRAGKIVRDTAWVEVDCYSVVSRSQRTKNAVSNSSSNPKSNTVRVPCPPSESRVDTFYSEHSRTEENTASLAVKDTTISRLQASLAAAGAKAEKTAAGRNAWRVTALISLFIIVLSVAVRLWKPKWIP